MSTRSCLSRIFRSVRERVTNTCAKCGKRINADTKNHPEDERDGSGLCWCSAAEDLDDEPTRVGSDGAP